MKHTLLIMRKSAYILTFIHNSRLITKAKFLIYYSHYIYVETAFKFNLKRRLKWEKLYQ